MYLEDLHKFLIVLLFFTFKCKRSLQFISQFLSPKFHHNPLQQNQFCLIFDELLRQAQMLLLNLKEEFLYSFYERCLQQLLKDLNYHQFFLPHLLLILLYRFSLFLFYFKAYDQNSMVKLFLLLLEHIQNLQHLHISACFFKQLKHWQYILCFPYSLLNIYFVLFNLQLIYLRDILMLFLPVKSNLDVLLKFGPQPPILKE